MTTVAIELNDQQCQAILVEAINKGLYAGVGGQIPPDVATRLQDATAIVHQAQTSYESGNRDDKVMSILFTANIDLKPPAGEVEGERNGAPKYDLSNLSEETLQNMATTLEGYASTPNVQAELEQVKAALAEKRGGSLAPPPPVAAAAPPAPPSEAAPSPPVGGGDGQRPQADGQVPAPAAIDATSQPSAETSQPSANGGEDPAEAPAQDGGGTTGEPQLDRSALEAQLTVPMMLAHGIALAGDVAALPDEALAFIIAHPEGRAQPSEELTAPTAPAPEAAQPVAVEQSAPTTPVAPPPPPAVSPERDALEAQVTGTMLKAYGLGRTNVPDIGDHMLSLMIDHPDGHVAQEDAEAARAADSGEGPPLTRQERGLVPPPPAVALALQPPEPPASTAPAPPAVPEEHPGEQADAFAPPAPQEPLAPEVAAVVEQQPASPPVPRTPSVGAQKAAEIIAKEGMPIPPEIPGEEAPILPKDLSKVSDDELRSFHARFHACESRMNWLVSEQEDEVSDLKMLARGREVEARAAVPKTLDGKRVTKDQLEAATEADPELKQLRDVVAEAEKALRKLKALRDNYRSAVTVCSRQWSMRHFEREGTPS